MCGNLLSGTEGRQTGTAKSQSCRHETSSWLEEKEKVANDGPQSAEGTATAGADKGASEMRVGGRLRRSGRVRARGRTELAAPPRPPLRRAAWASEAAQKWPSGGLGSRRLNGRLAGSVALRPARPSNGGRARPRHQSQRRSAYIVLAVERLQESVLDFSGRLLLLMLLLLVDGVELVLLLHRCCRRPAGHFCAGHGGGDDGGGPDSAVPMAPPQNRPLASFVPVFFFTLRSADT